MLNYGLLSDFDFEILCRDILSKRLNTELYYFSKGPDQGIDLADSIVKPTTIVQVKHYMNSSFSQLMASLKQEKEKLEKWQPQAYYVCTSKSLTRGNIESIYNEFQNYMASTDCIISKEQIDTFLLDKNNEDILRKHFKLWITADLVLNDLLHQDVFIDCEYLMDEIEDELPYFVQTTIFNHALEALKKYRKILLFGDPGVGKSITSKMLVLNFVKEGYAVRYATNSSLSDIKKSMSVNKAKKEIVFLDDFLGQHYMNLRSGQDSEILSLLRYIDRNKNKILVLNSRVTILNTAMEIFTDLDRYFNFNGIKMYRIDLNQITDVEKAKIFLAKLKRFMVPDEYYKDVRKNKRYRNIIKHKNFNPRVVEYICMPTKYQDRKPNQYFEFIMENFDKPKEIWKNEFESRLSEMDRLFMFTLYSITDNSVAIDRLIIAFNYLTRDILDTTIDHFNVILKRLNESLIKVEDNYGELRVKVLNPSINDYLKSSLSSNSNLEKLLKANAVYYEQISRISPKEEFEYKLKELILNHKNHGLTTVSPLKDFDLIIHGVAKYKILEEDFTDIIHQVLMRSLNDFQIGHLRISAIQTILVFLREDSLWDFYELKSIEYDEEIIEDFFYECTELDEAVDLTNLLKIRLEQFFIGTENLVDCLGEKLKEMFDRYFEDYEYYGEMISEYDSDELSSVYPSLYDDFISETQKFLDQVQENDIKSSVNLNEIFSYSQFTSTMDEIVDNEREKHLYDPERVGVEDITIDDVLNRLI
ncbi:hypothetical protein SLU01_11830 [Sporosarcina luteola]|uniref:Novel STAND NTPase 3 domain-containing protein n=1 Tax=Sporosarcina luteola TaxID=582850 RepID=A0A511Z606_9BACL|nr:hypothetical protein [Sporosarcina luteola]GEN82871.1 hypothetical protein SLU01_11830 [Sporosarcina luteola]